VRKGESDFQLAVTIAHGTKRFQDEQCFHCQQSAEKYLKAILEELGLTIPKTHILVAFLPLLVPHYHSLRSLRRGVDFLTRFAVDTRYPGDKASKRQAASALRWAGEVRAACRAILDIRPSRQRRRR
jgi:HEPN domain-containing protein